MFDDNKHPSPAGGQAAELGSGFFMRDPAAVARDLLGCRLVACVDDRACGGVIVETEAYLGADDPGSHAATRGVTRRNAVMYGPPGTVYVYLSYGCHHMLNLVCCPEGAAGAVLIRAIEPTAGLREMQARRGGAVPIAGLCSGPGRLTQALGLDISDNGSTLGAGRVTVYDGERVAECDIAVSGRVGLSDGHELELRYYVRGSVFVSRGRTGPSSRARSALTSGGTT